ncbi:hypothetical protein [Novosphingobium lindaniclasticum]
MASLALKLTDAGLAAVQGAAGSDKVVLSHLGLTATPFDYAPTLTVLPGEFKRIDVTSGLAAAANITHLTAYDYSADVWSATGLGLFMSDGVLFAIYTGADVILSKAALAFALLAFDISFGSDVAANIEYGNALFTNPPATTEMRGVVELATLAEGKAGLDELRALTAAVAKASLLDWLGFTPLDADAYTAADVLAKLLTVHGAGSALDADLLDGFDGSAYDRIVERSLIENGGYEVYASGKKVTWGKVDIPQDTYVTFNLPVAHTEWVNPSLAVSTAGGITDVQDNTGITAIVGAPPTGIRLWNADNRTITVWIRTIGV